MGPFPLAIDCELSKHSTDLQDSVTYLISRHTGVSIMMKYVENGTLPVRPDCAKTFLSGQKSQQLSECDTLHGGATCTVALRDKPHRFAYMAQRDLTMSVRQYGMSGNGDALKGMHNIAWHSTAHHGTA